MTQERRAPQAVRIDAPAQERLPEFLKTITPKDLGSEE